MESRQLSLFSLTESRRVAIWAVLIFWLFASLLTACDSPDMSAGSTASGPSRSVGSSTAAGSEILLVGVQDFAFDDFALALEGLGHHVSMNTPEVAPETDLVLVVVNAADGPMGTTRDAIEGFAGATFPRTALALTDVNRVPDPELLDLVLLESQQLLTRHGLTPVDYENIVQWPGNDVVATLDVHLKRSARNYRPTIPASPEQPTFAPTVEVGNLVGVPMADALRMLEEQGLKGELIADPAYGVVNDCNPLVESQSPLEGTVLVSGATIALIVSPPDTLDPAMARCLLPELTRAQIDARLAELTAQPSP